MSPGTIEIDHKQKINGNLYYALMKGNKNRVTELCQKIQDHALHVITVNDDTVLHMATLLPYIYTIRILNINYRRLSYHRLLV